jgi:Flp pilus assembly protein TadG
MTHRKRCTERGSTMVEMALVMLTFFCLLIGAIDFGQVLYFHQALVERARAAARYGSIDPTNTTAIQNVALYNSTSAGTAPLLSGLTAAMVHVTNSDNNTSKARVVVSISGYPIQFFSPYIAQTFNNQTVKVAMMAESQVP